MLWGILWVLAWWAVYVARDWRTVPFFYCMLVAIPFLVAMPMQRDLANSGLASTPWEKILIDQALWTLPWAAIGIVIWLFRRQPAND